MQPTRYRGPKVCSLAQITYRQLDHWCRTGRLLPVVPANGSGTQRQFDEDEVRIAWVLGRLSGIQSHGHASLEVSEPLRRLNRWEGWLVIPDVGYPFITPNLNSIAVGGMTAAILLDLSACPVPHPPLVPT